MNNHQRTGREREHQLPFLAAAGPLGSSTTAATAAAATTTSAAMSLSTSSSSSTASLSAAAAAAATSPLSTTITTPTPASLTTPTLSPSLTVTPISAAVVAAAAEAPSVDPIEEYLSFPTSPPQYPLLTACSFFHQRQRQQQQQQQQQQQNLQQHLHYQQQQQQASAGVPDSYIDDCFPPAQACNPEYGSTSVRHNYTYPSMGLGALSIDLPSSLPTPQRLSFSNRSPASQVSSLSSPSSTCSSMRTAFPLVKRPSMSGNEKESTAAEAAHSAATGTDNSKLVRVVLVFTNTDILSTCLAPWTPAENAADRRIVRFTKSLHLHTLSLKASIVELDESDLAEQTGLCSSTGLPYIELSCVRCHFQPENGVGTRGEQLPQYKYYITSIEIIKLIEFIIGTTAETPQDLEAIRKERGRIRSNLVPFWSKWTVNSKANLDKMHDINWRYRVEMGERIMAYKYRKPRDFDKEIRVLNWEKLEPALQRVLQNYYVHYTT